MENRYSYSGYLSRVIARVPALGAAAINASYYSSWGGQSRYMPLVFGATFFAVDVLKPELFRFAVAKAGTIAGRLAGATVALLVAVSLIACVSHFSGDRASEAGQSARAKQDNAAARAIVAASKETFSSAELERLAALKSAAAQRETERDTCGRKVCEPLKAEAAALMTRAADAKARQRAEAVIAATGPKINESETVAASIAHHTGVQIETVILAMCLVAAIALELAATVMPMAVDSLVVVNPPAANNSATTATGPTTPETAQPPAVSRMTRDQALADYIASRKSGPLPSNAELGRRWGTSGSTVAKWVSIWCAAGELTTTRRAKLSVVGRTSSGSV
jgi:hypothetical protein